MKHLLINPSTLVRRIVSAMILIASLSNVGALAQGQEQPNLFGIELLGRGLLYSANYERYVTPRIGLGVGGAYCSIDGNRVTIVPVYASWTPVGDRHSLYLAAGT